MGASSKTFVVVILMQLISIISAQEEVKRVPQGFVGMRGKKFTDFDELELYKRKPQFFVGVKGKKSFYDLLERQEADYKRAPMGFVGMRGKKEYPLDLYSENQYLNKGGSLIGEIDYSPNEGFNDIKEDFPLLNDIISEYLLKLRNSESSEMTPEDSLEQNEIIKRAANMNQFFGVRGKKSEQKRPFDLNFRGKFIGVRGKKDVKNSGAQEIKFLLGQNGPWPKRKQMGFFGMRGKKWTDGSSLEAESPN